jgi:hypothetical protein
VATFRRRSPDACAAGSGPCVRSRAHPRNRRLRPGRTSRAAHGAAVERFESTRSVAALLTLGDGDYTASPLASGRTGAPPSGGRPPTGWSSRERSGITTSRWKAAATSFGCRACPAASTAGGSATSGSSTSTRLGSARDSSRGSTTRSGSSAPWKVAVLHYPPFSCGGYFRVSSMRRPPRPAVRAARRGSRPRRPRPQLPALRTPARRHLRRRRRRRAPPSTRSGGAPTGSRGASGRGRNTGGCPRGAPRTGCESRRSGAGGGRLNRLLIRPSSDAVRVRPDPGATAAGLPRRCRAT